jgi:site-specific recombinase XerD
MQERLPQLKQTAAPELSLVRAAVTAQSNAVETTRLLSLVEDWLADCQIRQHSPRTIELRRMLAGRLFWFLEERDTAQCGRAEIRRFFAYLSNGHQDGGGRWGKGAKRYSKPLRPETISTYFHHLRTFFNWLVGEEYLQVSPMDKIAPPVSRPDQVQPFSTPQIQSLLNAASKTKYPRRDEAIVRFLLDTGVRVSELCQLKMHDLDLMEGQAFVLGKGNKKRVVCFGRKTARVLRAYLRDEERMPEQHVFLSERGTKAGEPFLRGGILQLIERLGKKANVQGVRCSPHTFRHTFAIEFLRNGGNVFTLKQILGHTGLQVTNRYAALAQADIQSQHRRFSPGDRI